MQRGVFRVGTVKGIGICLRYIYCIAINIGQFLAVSESTLINCLNTTTDGDGGKVGMTLERISTNFYYTVGDGDGGKTSTTRKRIIINACYAVGDCDGSKTGTTIEHTRTNAFYAVGDGDGG